MSVRHTGCYPVWPMTLNIWLTWAMQLHSVLLSHKQPAIFHTSLSGSTRDVHYLLTYLLTPWCRVLVEKLTGLQLVKKFPAFHGTRRFITPLTSLRHLSLSWASPFQSLYPHPTSWRSILILSTHLRLGLPRGFLPIGYMWRTYVQILRHCWYSACSTSTEGCRIMYFNLSYIG